MLVLARLHRIALQHLSVAAHPSSPGGGESLLRPGSFTIRDIPRRVAERSDLFRTVLTTRQVLPPIT